MVFVFLCGTDSTWCENLEVRPCCADGVVMFHLTAEQYSTVYVLLYTHLVYVAYVLHRLHPFLCQWTFSSLPCLGCGR